MITIKSQREIEAMDRAGDFLASIHIGLRDLIKPGLDLWEVEEYVRRRCKEENVLPLQIGVDGHMMDYPYATCCGINDEVAHAFPRHYKLKDGDLLKVDMVLSEPLDKSVLDVSKLDFNNIALMKKYTVDYTGGLADSCWAYAVGTVSQEVQDLMAVTKESGNLEAHAHEELFDRFFDRLPKEFVYERELLRSRLWRSPNRWELLAGAETAPGGL